MDHKHTFRAEPGPNGGFAVMRYLGSPKQVALFTSEAEAQAEALRLEAEQQSALDKGEQSMPRGWQRD